jgi:hypothetical protein
VGLARHGVAGQAGLQQVQGAGDGGVQPAAGLGHLEAGAHRPISVIAATSGSAEPGGVRVYSASVCS